MSLPLWTWFKVLGLGFGIWGEWLRIEGCQENGRFRVVKCTMSIIAEPTRRGVRARKRERERERTSEEQSDEEKERERDTERDRERENERR